MPIKWINTYTNDPLEVAFKKYVDKNYKCKGWWNLSSDYELLERFIRKCPLYRPKLWRFFHEKMLAGNKVNLERRLFLHNFSKLKAEMKTSKTTFKLVIPKQFKSLTPQ